jgi:hypothetical protein
MDSVTRFFASGFFHESVSPQPRVFHLDRFEFFRKFAQIFASQGAPPGSMTPVANLPPVSTTPATKLPPISTTPVANLPPVSLTPVAKLELRMSPRIFEKIRNGPNGRIRGLGETDSRKKPEAKNLVTLSL